MLPQEKKQQVPPLRFASVGMTFRLKVDDFAREINKVTAFQGDDSCPSNLTAFIKATTPPLVHPERSRGIWRCATAPTQRSPFRWFCDRIL